MGDDSGYTTLTRYISVDFFKGMIESNIKKLINTYGHKNCGLRQEELCNKIKEIIPEKKNIIFRYMDSPGKRKWSNDWDRERSKYFDKLYKEEGFINMCFPKTYPKKNQSLDQLLSRHIKFCKKKDEWRAAIGESREYSVCLEYNKWIIAEESSFTSEYLQNVQNYKINTVKKFFITKKHPEGYNPLTTYHGIKLDCEIYNPASNKYQEKLVEKAPTKSRHPPAPSDVGQESQGKSGKSTPDRVGDIQKNKPGVQILHQTKPSSSDSHISSLSNTKEEDTPNGQHTDLKAKGTGPLIIAQVATGQATEATDAKTPSPQQLPESPRSISPKDSSTDKVLNPPSPVIKGQHTVSDSTPRTTSATPGTTHSIQSVPSPSTSDLSLSQPQPSPVDPGIANNSKESTPPDPVIKSTDQGASLIFALDPGLAPSKAEASSSSVSGTSPTLVSTTTDSITGSPRAQDPLLITVPPQSTTTTPIVTTPALIQTTPVMSGPATVSAMGTKVIPSTTEGHGKPQVPIKTASDSQDPTFASPEKQDDTIQSHLGAQSLDPQTPYSGASANLNSNPSPDQRLRTPPVPLGPFPGSPADPLLGLSSGLAPEISPTGSSDLSIAVHSVVNHTDNIKITTSSKYAPPHYIGTTLISNTPSPKVTYPSEKPSIEPTEFPPLINIIPTTLILLATLTILFLLYKYTPFGLFLGRRRRKKKDLRTVFEIPEESAYESPNETIHKWDDHLGRQIMENDVYVKLLKINRYKKEMQRKKKKRDTTLIEVHMEILEECKNDEWELHKGDFLEVCLQEFMNEKNRTAENWRNAELTVNNTKTDKIIQDAEENEILWNFWMGNYRNILESWKSEEWFQSLKNEWKKERQKNHNKIDEIEENTLKESGMISIECEKDIWKKWISKQATLIENFKQKDWFKSLIEEQENIIHFY
ncbi:STP1 protein [Plasmodium ovale wallikeri]|uniref:STP1 protein n=1 Tax=Plasmodium ovale wallikeri TaxID=864142 RepID=A0A1A9AIR0_PLAOA|nr:STP1 protein [Plasmodium ovale wallikeri]